MTYSKAARRIPDNIDDNDLLAGYRLRDMLVAAVPALVALIVTQYISVLPEGYTLPLVGVSGVIGVFLLVATPDHLNTETWVKSYYTYLTQPKNVQYHASEYGMAREGKEYVAEGKMWEADETTQEAIRIKKFHPSGNAVERDDGDMVGALRIDGANMALASEETWNRMVGQWGGFLNNTCDFPLQLYATSRTFPVKEYIDTYRRRRNDPDLTETPILKGLLEDYMRWYPSEYLTWQGVNERRYFIIISVSENEIYGRGRDESSALEPLTKIPKIGGYVKRYMRGQAARSEAEKKVKMMKELNQRLETTRMGVDNIGGCHAYKMSAGAYAILLKEYWSGREIDGVDGNETLHRHPVVGSSGEAVTPAEVASADSYKNVGKER